MIYKLYKIDHLGRHVGEDETYSDHEIDLSRYAPPKGYTFIPPPKAGDGEVPVFENGSWRLAKASEFEPPKPSLEDLKAAKEVELEMAWGAAMAQGYESASTGLKVKCEPLDISMFQMGLSKAALSGKLKLLRDFDGNIHRGIPFPTVETLVVELRDHVEALWERKVLLQEQVRLAATAEELEKITWKTEVKTLWEKSTA